MAKSSEHKGWRYDRDNNRLYMTMNGEDIAYMSSSGINVVTGGMVISGGIDIHGTTTISGATTVAGNTIISGTATIDGKVTFANQVAHAFESTNSITTSVTLTVTDCGRVLTIPLSGVVLTLPATVLGYNYTVVNAGATDGIGNPRLTPNASDMLLGASLSGIDNKYIENTQATSKIGDLIEITGDGSVGWYIQRQYGTWAAQS